MTLPAGQISYHYRLADWDDFDGVAVLDHAPKWDGHDGPETVRRLLEWAPPTTNPRFVIVRTRPGIDGATVTNVGGIAYRDRESAQAAADVLRRVADVTEGHEDRGATLTVHEIVPAE